MFSKYEEKLLEKVKNLYTNSSLWKYYPEIKFATLLDIHAGFHPDIMERNESLVKQYSYSLVEYCEREYRLFPVTKEKNEILNQYSDKIQEKYKSQKQTSQPCKKTGLVKNNKTKSALNFNKPPAIQIHDPLDDEYVVSRRDIAFMIEGEKSKPLPEVRLAIHLARTNGCSYFDIISSYDSFHLAKALEKVDEAGQKEIILCTYLVFSGEGRPQSIIDKILIPPYKYLVEQGTIAFIPPWVTNLNPSSMDSFAQSVCSSFEDIEAFKKFNKQVRENLTKLSNNLSRERLINYLETHPEINTIYGLTGSLHLPMISSAEDGSIDNEYVCTKISVNERIINVHLFGSYHGRIEGYKRMEAFIEKTGFIIPETNSVPKMPITNEIYQNFVLQLMENFKGDSTPSDNDALSKTGNKRYKFFKRNPAESHAIKASQNHNEESMRFEKSESAEDFSYFPGS